MLAGNDSVVAASRRTGPQAIDRRRRNVRRRIEIVPFTDGKLAVISSSHSRQAEAGLPPH